MTEPTTPSDPSPAAGPENGQSEKRSLSTAAKVWIGIAIAVAVVVLIVAAALFQPWRIWTTTVVDETLPSSTPVPTVTVTATPDADIATPTAEPEPEPVPVDLATGTFISHEHETTGTVRIVEQPDGSRILAIENLQTSDGPDLKVWLSDQPVIEGTDGWGVFDDGEYLDLGALKGNVGNQLYEIPADADLSLYSSVSIWCARFAVSFGAAELIATS